MKKSRGFRLGFADSTNATCVRYSVQQKIWIWRQFRRNKNSHTPTGTTVPGTVAGIPHLSGHFTLNN